MIPKAQSQSARLASPSCSEKTVGGAEGASGRVNAAGDRCFSSSAFGVGEDMSFSVEHFSYGP
jgi:hypothetical protein